MILLGHFQHRMFLKELVQNNAWIEHFVCFTREIHGIGDS